MIKFLHVSDLHIHANNDDNSVVLDRLQLIATNYPEHHLLLTGDVTDDGSLPQYENAYETLLRFKGKIYITPGNHDFGVLGNFYSESRARMFDDFLAGGLGQGGTFCKANEPVVNIARDENSLVMIISIDSNLETTHPFDFACGAIGDKQLNTLAAVINDRSVEGAIKILIFHHHPFNVYCPSLNHGSITQYAFDNAG